MRRMTGASLKGSRPAQISTSDWRGENAWRSMPKRARSNRLAAVAMNSMAQHAVPKGMGQSELARDRLTALSSRVVFTAHSIRLSSFVVSQLSEPSTVCKCFIDLSIPLKCASLPDVDVAHEEDHEEHQHFDEQEPHPGSAGGA